MHFFKTCLHILHIIEYVLSSSSYKVCKTKMWNKTFISSHNYSLPDTFLAEKVRLRAFTASRKSSRKIPQASRYRKKIRLRGIVWRDGCWRYIRILEMMQLWMHRTSTDTKPSSGSYSNNSLGVLQHQMPKKLRSCRSRRQMACSLEVVPVVPGLWQFLPPVRTGGRVHWLLKPHTWVKWQLSLPKQLLNPLHHCSLNIP